MGMSNTSPPSRFLRAHIDLESPIAFGISTVPHLIEHNARHNPHHGFCIQAQKHSKPTAGLSTGPQLLSISHSQFKRAIATCQTRLLETVLELELPSIGKSGSTSKGPPIALFVESDVGLLAHLFALMGLGVPALLLSARLSPTAVHHLLSKTATRAIIVSPRLRRTAQEALSLFATTGVVPATYSQDPFTSFLDVQQSRQDVGTNICREGSEAQDSDRNVLILHSSGTTGLPKPIYHSHKWLLSFATCHDFTSEEEALSLSLSTLPLYHGYGLVTPALSLAIGKTFCIPPPSIVPTGTSITNLLSVTNALSLISVPSILEDVVNLPHGQGIGVLAKLQFVAFGGGLLKASVGEKLISNSIKVLNHYGSTESGPIAPFFVPGPDYDWSYFRLRTNVKMQIDPGPVLEDGTQSFTLTTYPFGWQEPFVFQDQLICNPQKPTTDFSAIGRKDDLVVLANGEKVNPRILEAMLFECSLVSAAIVFGDGQFEIGVIVQPSSPLSLPELEAFKSAVWPIIRQAGERMDTHARISSKGAILVAPPDALLPRSDKGSLMRKEAHRMFEAEIAAVYQALNNRVAGSSTLQLRMDDLVQDLKSMVQTGLVWRLKPEDWTVDDDLFEMGMDSLQALQLRRLLLSSLPSLFAASSQPETLPQDIIYQNPTVTQLAEALKMSTKPLSDRSLIETFVERYSSVPNFARKQSDRRATILVTGATGSLGSHVLAHLASLQGVLRIICLNRPHETSDCYTHQIHRLRSKGISIDSEAWAKVEIVQTNTAASSLGLKEDDFSRISAEVTHILHAAWPVDFKRRLSSFKAQFQTLQNLTELALAAHATRSQRRIRLLFVSSIAVVGQYPAVVKEAIVPEVPMEDLSCTNDIGYARAKLVCEKMVERIVRDHSAAVEAAYVRLGQTAGSTKSGSWNSDEHIAALFKSSQAIGSLPKLGGTFSWLPVDVAAEVLSDLLMMQEPTKVVYHLENPVRQPWLEALESLSPHLGLSGTDIVPFPVWLERLSTFADDAGDSVPAKKLYQFFKQDFVHMACGGIVLDTRNTRDASATLRRTCHIADALLKSYIANWKRTDYLA